MLDPGPCVDKQTNLSNSGLSYTAISYGFPMSTDLQFRRRERHTEQDQLELRKARVAAAGACWTSGGHSGRRLGPMIGSRDG